MTVQPVLVASPVGTYSLAGVQTKVSAGRAYRLACRCGWNVTGQIEGDQFIANPTTTEG
jgi:hypothetical protein